MRGRSAGGGRTRISGGSLRGRLLSVHTGVRPTEARLREALFSIWHERVPGSRFLDLFAGSGAVGLEALSRGAAEVWGVEGSAAVARALEENVKKTGAEGCRLIRAELPAGLSRLAGSRFDLIFADPPYAFEGYEELLQGAGELLAEDGVLALEHARRRDVPSEAGPLRLSRQRTYGEKAFSFYSR